MVWMGREALGRAFDRDGAFNDVQMRLDPGANQRAVIDAVDQLLARHGGRGAYGRDRMLSAQFLADELTSLRTMASILPPFFLAVAVFLLNVSLSRLVATERSNIGLLKSFGYGNSTIASHYAKFALSFSLLGALRRHAGRALGRRSTSPGIYATVYRIPGPALRCGPGGLPRGAAVALLAALAGATQAVLRAIAPAAGDRARVRPLPPASAGWAPRSRTPPPASTARPAWWRDASCGFRAAPPPRWWASRWPWRCW